jgi:hypothetical protein
MKFSENLKQREAKTCFKNFKLSGKKIKIVRQTDGKQSFFILLYSVMQNWK